MMTLFQRILVPYDFSARATAALEMAVELAARHRGRVQVLHVLAESAVAPEVVWSSRAKLRAGFEERLEREVGTVLGKRARRVECKVVIGEPIRGIRAAARKADLVIMATLGQTGLAHRLLGSTTDEVVRFSPVPVLLTRAAAAQRGGGKARRRPARARSR